MYKKEYAQLLNEIVLHEQNLIDGKIATKDLKTWEEFKLKVNKFRNQISDSIQIQVMDTSNLKMPSFMSDYDYFDEGEELEFDNKVLEENCFNYIDFLKLFIKKIEEQYRSKINSLLEINNEESIEQINEIMKTIFSQLQTLCKYIHLGNNKNLIVEQSEFDKKHRNEENSEYCEVIDSLGKKYNIKKAFVGEFQELCEQEKSTKEETNQVYTCVFGTKREKLELCELYDKKIDKLRISFLAGNYNITSIKTWNVLKAYVSNLRQYYTSLVKNIMDVEGMKYNGLNGKSQKFIELLDNCIQTIETNQNDNLKEEEQPFFIETIYNICKYEDILESKNAILVQTKLYKRNFNNTVTINDVLGEVEVEPAKVMEYSELVKLQKQLQEKYNEAYSLVFGNTTEEEPKRGM